VSRCSPPLLIGAKPKEIANLKTGQRSKSARKAHLPPSFGLRAREDIGVTCAMRQKEALGRRPKRRPRRHAQGLHPRCLSLVPSSCWICWIRAFETAIPRANLVRMLDFCWISRRVERVFASWRASKVPVDLLFRVAGGDGFEPRPLRCKRGAGQTCYLLKRLFSQFRASLGCGLRCRDVA
jgi:hypothetical protein